MLAAIAAALCGITQRSSGCQLAILLPLVFSVVGDATAQAEHPQISARRAVERKTFTDAQIAGGFFKIAFGAEFHVAGRVDRIRKYAGPVRVYVDSMAKPDRREQVAQVVADIRSHVKHLDIAMAEERDSANVLVTLVRDRDLPKTIRALYGRDRARQIQRSLEPQCLSGFRKDPEFRIIKSDVLLVVDAGDFIFYDCVYEELLQALGPINDDPTVPWSMFNDNVQMGFFDVYDQYLLNILYDPRIQPGMTREQVKALLPQILPDVRAFVASVNDLNAASSAAKPGKKRR
jgi:predicted component of type VI protein secretion system